MLGTAAAALGGLVALGGGLGGGRGGRDDGVLREVEAYGDSPLQRGEWWLPPAAASAGRLPAVVLVHGGYWQPGYGRSLEDAVAADLARRGWLVWNIDYRAADAGWPDVLADAAAAADHLVHGRYADHGDPARTAVVGHSAGGHLALRLASRGRLPAGAPGARSAAPVPALVVAQAPVASLLDAEREQLGDGAVLDLTGGTSREVPERYRVADPVALLPTGVPSVLLHSDADALVPVRQSEAYVAAALAAGDRSRLVRVPGDHFAHLRPDSEAVEQLRRALAEVGPG